MERSDWGWDASDRRYQERLRKEREAQTPLPPEPPFNCDHGWRLGDPNRVKRFPPGTEYHRDED